jgi:hypothetical protein
MSNPLVKFFCKICGPREKPCEHWERHVLEKLLVLMETVHAENLEIIHLLKQPESATLRLTADIPSLVGAKSMPATVLVGGTANSLFQEWTGPNGTGTVVPNAGPVTFSSDNPAVATVDPSSGVATGVSAGTANISGVDSANSLSASDVLTVTAPPPPPAVSATLTLTANP